MPLMNPVPGFDFNVLLMDAEPLPSTTGGLATAALGAGISLAKTALFGAFSSVSGLNAEMEVEEYREGGRNTDPHKFVKWAKYPNLVLKRGVTFNSDIWDWYYTTLHGTEPITRKNGLILLTDRGGAISSATGGPSPLGLPLVDRLPVAAWWFRNGLPERLEGPGLDAKTNEIAIETLEIAHEGIDRLGPGLIPGGVGEALTSVGL